MLKIITASDEETQELGRKLASLLPLGTVVALTGDLGCGKTVISRGIARGLGITEPVTSPTFTVAQEYHWGKDNYLYHLDMYRISDENAALAFGIDEFLFNPHAITLVEWPERIAGLLADPRLRTIHFEHLDINHRSLEFKDWPEAEIRQVVPDGT